MLGDFIRSERHARRWSQATLAERSGLAQTYISGLERGQYENPGLEVIRALAGAFELSLNEFLQRAGVPVAPRSPTLAELRQLAEGASPVAQQFLRDLEEDYEVVSEETWHILTQVFQGQIARDRAKRVAQRGQGATRPAPAEDTPDTPSLNGSGPDRPAGRVRLRRGAV